VITTKVQQPTWGDQSAWNWAISRGYILKIYTPDRKIRFDVLILGASDYVAVNVDTQGNYDPEGELTLYSVNGEFRFWVEEGLKGPIRGVRWAVQYSTYTDEYHKPHWKVSGDCLAMLAVEQIMGEVVNQAGEVIGTK
jgi:hypothetical protein